MREQLGLAVVFCFVAQTGCLGLEEQLMSLKKKLGIVRGGREGKGMLEPG